MTSISVQAKKMPDCFDLMSSAYTVSSMHTDKPEGQPLNNPRTAKPLIAPQIRDAEAKRLKALYEAKKRTDPSLNQEKIADLCGWSGQSVVSQYLNGKIALNLSALVKFANVLGFDPKEVSPRLLGEHLQKDVDLSRPVNHNAQTHSHTDLHENTIHPIEVWDDDTPLGADEVELPFFKEVELSAGNGSAVMLETNGRKLRFGKRTLQRKNIDPASAGCVPVTGNSMEPVLPDGSTVGVDTGAVAVQDGKMYALDHDGLLRVKLLYRQPGGGLRLRSYNDSEHPDERYDGSYVNDHIRIIGKVFWYSVLL